MDRPNPPNEITEAGWIYEENLLPCLQMAASSTSTPFDDGDWDAVRFGLQGTSEIDDRWFGYVLTGANARLEFSCALDDGDTSAGIIHIRFGNLSDAIVAAKLSTILSICSEYTFSNPDP